jgi:DNA invertase Pin-like site-specific DNA recombinase
MILSPKIEARHQRLQAIVYIRQSTPKQVQNHQESTRRQYALAERARQMGWPAAQVRVIDEDLGLSGTSSRQRTGFQKLVVAIGLGEVGIVLVTEVSRLSRCNSDWHRVIELCGVFRTLIADEDGVYDARDPNDLLLLGVKGTLFAAELHILRGRMRGNLLNKARRGELALRLPVGFRRRPDEVVVQDPDDAVRLAIGTVFERFAVLRNARAVQRHFLENRLVLPRCAQTGAAAGSISWVRPSYQMIQQILTNPAYAGVFVYGRRRREAVPGDPPALINRRVALTEWDIVVPGVYPAYLTYDAYLANRRTLQDNLYNFARKGGGAPREGPALLAGLVVCGRCGRRMAVSYGSAHHCYHCRRAQADYGEPQCQSCPVGALDALVTAAFLEAVAPAGLEATLAALETLERDREAIDRQWRLRLERARYEVALAQRQYDAVDPDNRLVVRELERRWNAALSALETLESDYALMRRTDLLPLDAAEREEVRRIAADLPGLWRAETTTAVDRKRLLRLAIAAVTVTTDRAAHRIDAVILWTGGATSTHTASLPPVGLHAMTDAAVISRIRELSRDRPDHAVAQALNAAGLRTQTGKEWTYARVQSMRKLYAIPTGCPIRTGSMEPRADGRCSGRAAARRLGVSPSLVHLWVQHGIISCDQRCSRSKLWVRLTDTDIARLDGSTDVSGLPTLTEVAEATGMEREAIWARVRRGDYVAFRTSRGRGQWEWRLQEHPAAGETASPCSIDGNQQRGKQYG